MHVHSYLQLQFSYKDIRIFLSSAILKSRLQKILMQWSMGHSGDDVNDKKPHKMKTHWPNQLKISVLVYFKVLYRTRYKNIDVILDYTCPMPFNFAGRTLLLRGLHAAHRPQVGKPCYRAIHTQSCIICIHMIVIEWNLRSSTATVGFLRYRWMTFFFGVVAPTIK